jgi:hypothetical protein
MANTNERAFYVDNSVLSTSMFKSGLITLNPVAIGTSVSPYLQKPCGIAIGNYAGVWAQGTCAVALGEYAGSTFQGEDAIAMGSDAGSFYQNNEAVAVGAMAGQFTQGLYAVAVGAEAGQERQGVCSLAIGKQAGQYFQSSNAIAIGCQAGQYSQSTNAIAIGNRAGRTQQPEQSIVINATGVALGSVSKTQALYVAPIASGTSSNVLYYDTSSKEISYGAASTGVTNGSTYSQYLFWNPDSSAWTIGGGTIRLGEGAGYTQQQTSAVALGLMAGHFNQGSYAIAIGREAGKTNQPEQSIVINASGAALGTVTKSQALYVAPIGSGTSANVLYYDTTSKEISYGAPSGGGGGGPDAGQRVAVLGRYDFGTPDTAPSAPPAPSFSGGTIRYVGSVGGDFATVALAIAAANAGDIIEIRAGYTSNETASVSITKSLEIRGQNRSTSVITAPTTTIAVGSNGVSLPQATINVASTAGFPTSGTLHVFTTSWQTVTYTGITGTSFTGCSGGTGTMSTGNNVYLAILTGLLSVAAGVNNVYIHTATIRNNTVPALDSGGLSTCITAATMTQAYPLGSSGLYFSDLDIIHPRVGIAIQGAGFVIDNCALSCNTTLAATTVRSVINYGQTGTCFFQNCTVTATLDVTPRTVVMYLTANNSGTGTFVPGHTGNFVVKNLVQNNTCNAYYLQDVFHQPDVRNGSNYQNAPLLGGFGLWFSSCTFNGQYSGNPISFTEATTTSIAAGSNGAVLPQATINVGSAAAFPATGSINVLSSSGWQTVTYTGKTATSFTGCTGGVGTLTTGNNVNGLNPLSFFNNIYVSNCVGQSRTTGDNKGFIAVAGTGGTVRQIGAPTLGLWAVGVNTFNSPLPSATYVNGSTLANFLGVLTTTFATPSPLITVVNAQVPSGAVTSADGFALAIGSRVWLVSQSPVYSGIYTVNAGLWTRTADFADGTSVNATYFWVKSGTIYGNTQWECTNAVGGDVVGTDALTWQPASVYYIPRTPTDWSGTPPTTISGALDRIATLLKTLNSGIGP